ncbi:MAG: NAD(P)/FAD-dependent oxidoreductase, partial [Gaiellaceae bacterium]
SVPAARVDEIVRGAVPYFRDWRPERRLHAWAGFRPLTPDGLPFIGRLPRWEQLYVAAGHGTMGFTLAPATGEALARLVAGDAPADLLAPFRPDRAI